MYTCTSYYINSVKRADLFYSWNDYTATIPGFSMENCV